MAIRDKKEKIIPISIGIVFVLLLSALLYFSPGFMQNWLARLENLSYDVMLKIQADPIKKETPIIIVDIDDKSLSEIGRWPWSRKVMGELVTNLYSLGAKVVAFDIVFPEAERNAVEEVIQRIKGSEMTIDLPALESAKELFNYDQMFADSLSKGQSVLGFVLTNEGKPVGQLPQPLVTLTPEMIRQVYIPEKKSYLSNLPNLEKAAATGGFINATPDADGVLRYSPMLLRFGNGVFPSLSLAATKLFLNNPEFSVVIGGYQGSDHIEAIKLGDVTIPTDPYGRILVPFRGPPYSVQYVSASDVLLGKVAKVKIEDKLVFVGSSATALGDLVASAISPIFIGIEVHAHIASGILENYLPFKPNWHKGAGLALVFFIGMALAFGLPFLGPILSSILAVVLIAGLILIGHYIWDAYGTVFPIVFPIFLIATLYIVNEVCGYLFESRRRKDMKSVFGQYVPPECIDSMMKKSEDFMKGESKELSVLFSDIRSFTSISEKLNAGELKNTLGEFLTPMTEVIFNQKGTIDKYVGDMIMAFWGAPLEDPTHAEHAIQAGLEMHWKLGELNDFFKKNNRPELHIGVGVNTGTMNVGDMGSQYRKAYTVLGDAVNLGSRLESLTKAYHVKILVGEKTHEITQNAFSFRLIDRVKVKGKDTATNIFEPLGRKIEESPEMRSMLEKHAAGFDAYTKKSWDEAERIFNELKDKDQLYEVYLERIKNLREHPPEEGWDGTTVLESK